MFCGFDKRSEANSTNMYGVDPTEETGCLSNGLLTPFKALLTRSSERGVVCSSVKQENEVRDDSCTSAGVRSLL